MRRTFVRIGESSLDPRRIPWTTVTIVLVLLLPLGNSYDHNKLEESKVFAASGSAPDANLYKLYFTEPGQNMSSGMDGLISTRPPSANEDQLVASALDDDVQFMTIGLMSSMDFFGRKFHSNESYYIPVELFMKAEGPQNSNIDWTVSIITTSGSIGSTTFSGSVCTSSWQSSCDFDHEIIEVGIGGSESFRVKQNERLIIKVRASMSGCDGSDSPFGGSDCSADIAFNKIDNEDNKFSKLEANGNALINSIIKVQRDGANIAESSELDWYPNDVLEDREMQFSIDAMSSFGRSDISRVDILMRSPDGNYEVDERITGDMEDIVDSSNGIYGTYLHTYRSGLPSGEYTVSLRVSDVGGNEIEIEHEPIDMHQFGVSIKETNGNNVIFVAPEKVIPITMQLVHRGDSTKSMTVHLEVLTDLGSSWLIEFDSPEGYEMSSGGTILNPTMTLTSPDDLTGMPKKIEIRAVAEADVEGVISVVHQDTLTLNVEKIDANQPPVVSIWDEDHKIPIANSSRGDVLDSSIPRFAEYGEFNPFILEIFNSGFDSDSFRIDIVKRSKAIFQLFDNRTGLRIEQDEGDGTFHTTLLERHNTMVLILGVKPSVDREDEDIGEVELEVISSEDASIKTTVSFTIQRTYGIRGEISQDCDGTPLGHMKVSLCSPGQNNPYMEFRARITNSDTELDAASWWLLQEPQDLAINTDRNPAYGNWVFEIRDTDGNSLPRISLGPGDFTEVQITAELTSQVEAGNHTVFLRIVEETEEDEPRYFDLPITFEVESDQPMLEIVQKDPNTRLSPGNEYSIRMEVQNDGNSRMTVLLGADVESSGWDVSIGGLSGSPLIEIEAFESATFTLEISVPESANNGDEIPIVISATPLDTEQSFSESQTARFTLTAMVEIGSFSQIIANEISHPRPITLVLLVVGTILLFAGVQTRMNRRRWAKQMRMIESLSEIEEDAPYNETQIPAPVTMPEAPETVDRYDDEDVELI